MKALNQLPARILANRNEIGVVALAWGIGWAVVIGAACVELGNVPSLQDFVHFDSVHYLSIASSGYVLFPCTPDIGLPGTWCGNTAWQPLYPLLAWGVSLITGLPTLSSAFLVTYLFSLLLLLVINSSIRRVTSTTRFLILVTAAVFPGAVWMHSIFPMGLVLTFGFLSLQAVNQERFIRAGVFAGLSVLSHSSGFIFAVCALAIVLFGQQQFSVRTVIRYLLPLIGLIAAWLLFLAIQTGNVLAWWLVQQKYYAEGQSPVSKIKNLLTHLSDVTRPADNYTFWPSLQTWLVIVMVVIYAVSIYRSREFIRRKVVHSFNLVMLGLFPFLLGGQLSVSRNESQLVGFSSRIPINNLGYLALAGLSAVVDSGISGLFFGNAIA